MNRHGRKASVEMPGVVAANNGTSPAAAAVSNINENSGFMGGGSEYGNDFALPSLGKQGAGAAAVSQLSGRNQAANGVTSNFSSRKRDGRNEAARASLSDSDFDF